MKKWLIIAQAMAVASVLVACSDAKETNEESNLDERAEENLIEQPVENPAALPEESEAKINDSEEALAYLKTKRPEFATQDTVILDVTPSTTTDKKGAYYVVTISSRAMREQGGKDVLGFFKVYMDGTVESHY